jgi:hypothetical protein
MNNELYVKMIEWLDVEHSTEPVTWSVFHDSINIVGLDGESYCPSFMMLEAYVNEYVWISYPVYSDSVELFRCFGNEEQANEFAENRPVTIRRVRKEALK